MSSAAAAAKKKKTKKEEEETAAGDAEPDYSTQITRVLMHMRANGPINRSELPMILQNSTEETDFARIWEQLKKSIYTKWEESSDRLSFEHILQSVNSANLQDFIEKRRQGVSREELTEFNQNIVGPIHELLRNASVLPLLGWRASNKKTLMLFPRGTDFKVPLSGTINVRPDSRFLETTQDLRKEIRRGDALIIDGKTYRVSADTLNQLSEKELRELIEDDLGGDYQNVEERDMLEARAQALLSEKGAPKRYSKRLAMTEGPEILQNLNEFSSSSYADPIESSKGPAVYKYEFDATRLPLDRPYKGNALIGATVHKFGCTNDVREAYWKVAENPSNNYKVRDTDRLDAKLRERRLISSELLDGINRSSREKAEAQARRLAEVASGKPVKKQRRMNMIRKVTNVHMQD